MFAFPRSRAASLLPLASTLALASLAAIALADPPRSAPAAQGAEIPANAAYETGDSWIVGGTHYQLYGVQSCLRGTRFTNAHGQTRDCGEASLAVLASLVRDLKPLCREVAYRSETKTAFVSCFADLAKGPARGARIDLGAALITLGWAYAALLPDGRAMHPTYLAAERLAEGQHAGLWAFTDVINPNALILRAYRNSHDGSSAAFVSPRRSSR